MKKILSLLTMLIVCIAALVISASAATVDSGTCGAEGDNLQWTLDSDGTLTVYGTGAMAEYDSADPAPWWQSSAIKTLIVEDGVTNVNGFFDCKNLTSVTLGKDVAVITSTAFSGCSQLESIEIPAGVKTIERYAFSSCTKLATVTGAAGVTYIESHAFDGCDALTSFQVPAAVTSMGSQMFLNCDGLESITVDAANTKFCAVDGVLYNKSMTELWLYPVAKADLTFDIPVGVTTVKSCAFQGVKAITAVTVPDGVTSLETFAFGGGGCKNLASVTFKGAAPAINAAAFSHTTTTCHYPAGDDSWDGIAGQSYGGTLTWEKTYVAEGTCGDNLTWELTEDGVLTVSGTGAMEWGIYNAPWYSLREDITKAVIQSGVTTIGKDAFYDCRALTTVTFADGSQLESIGERAFYNCMDLTDITIPAGVTSIGRHAFYWCSALTTVTFADGSQLKSIEESAFETCMALTGITIPDGVTTIGADAFHGCSKIAEVEIPASVTSIDAYAFSYNSSLTAIKVDEENPNYSNDSFGVLFNKDKTTLIKAPAGALVEYEIPDGVTSIGKWAFCDSKNLTALTIPGSVKTILWGGIIGQDSDGCVPGWHVKTIRFLGDAPTFQSYAFICSKGVTVEYPANNATWTADVMQQYEGSNVVWQSYVPPLARGTCGDNLKWELTEDDEGTLTISGTGAMEWDSSDAPWYSYGRGEDITKVVIQNGVTTIGDDAFSDCTALTDVAIPDSVTTIGEWAFYDCTALTSVTIPAGVTSIGYGAFSDCTALTTVTFADGGQLKSIGERAFYDCKALTGITIPDGMTTIGADAFHGCSKIAEVEIPASVTSIDAYAFSYNDSLTAIKVDEENPNYSNDSFGVLFNKDKTTLIKAPAGALVEYEIPDGVTSIGKWAFCDCKNLTALTIPGSVKNVVYGGIFGADSTGTAPNMNQLETIRFLGDAPTFKIDAFTGFWGVTVEYPANNATWTADVMQQYNGRNVVWQSYVPVLASGTCGDDLTWELTEDGVLTVSGEGAMNDFENGHSNPWYNYRTKITKAVVKEGVTSIGNYAFYGVPVTRVTLPKTVASIGTYAFGDCTSLQSVTVPADSGLTTIGIRAFTGCTALTGFSFPEGLTTIKDNAFQGCATLTALTLPGSTTAIQTQAFRDCEGLTAVTIPAKVTTFGSGVFSGCGKLTDITVAAGNTALSVSDGVLFNAAGTKLYQYPAGKTGTAYTVPAAVTDIWDYAFYEATALKSVTFAEESALTSISNYAFAQCSGLEAIAIPEGVTILKGTAFQNCTALAELTLPESLITLSSKTFAGCTALTSVTIPENVATLNGYVFDGCTGLEEVTFLGDAPTIGTNTFRGVTATVYCPLGDDSWDGVAGQSYGGDLTWKRWGVEITGQPADAELTVGESTTFTVAAEGEGLTYRWQYRKNASDTWKLTYAEGYKTNALTIPGTADRNGYQYRCKVTDGGGNSLFSNHATLTVKNPLAITGQPESADVNVGDTVKFTVTAEGNGLKYQWQYRPSATGTWKNSGTTGNKTATLTVTTNIKHDGYQYRCKVTDAGGESLFSEAAGLTVKNPLAITGQPGDVTAAAGSTAKFAVEAEGSGLTYQWQYRISSTGAWKAATASGNKTATLKVPATWSRDGYQYRCRITDSNGGTAISDIAVLTVVEALEIVTQPKDVEANVGSTAKFAVEAEGSGLTYQWQYRLSATGAWKAATASGNKTATLKVPATLSRSGYQYRCVITDSYGTTATTAAVTLTVTEPLVIVSQPEDSVKAKGNALFFVEVEGSDVTYQWQYKTATGTKWINSPATGNKTDTLKIPVTADRDGNRYRCVITDAHGQSVTSEAATLTVFGIVTQPKSVSAEVGGTAKFTVEAVGEELSYQWQYRTSSTGTWKSATATGNKTATLKVPATVGRDGYQYRCVVTGEVGSVKSAAVTLNVN